MYLKKIIGGSFIALLALGTCSAPFTAFAQTNNAKPKFVHATRVAHAITAPMLAATRAGNRLVAVGSHGVILLSDNEGQDWRQAEAVPFDGMLTGVSFADEKHGWAVGHAGIILHTRDGGRTWVVQRSDTSVDQPLFAVHFFDAKRGVAVGLWSLVLLTSDGGKTWEPQSVLPMNESSRADLNLLSLFSDEQGNLYATAEKGQVLHSGDHGRTWRYLNTGYAGSLWSGVALADGTLLVGGLRGSLYRSEDRGRTWAAISQARKSSLTGFASTLRGGREAVFAASLNGDLLKSSDRGKSFEFISNSPGGANAITALHGDKVLLLTRAGPELLPKSD